MLEHNETPQPLIIDGEALREARQRYRDGDAAIVALVERLLPHADKALTAGPFTVTAKPRPGPSGDIHDYVSMVTTFWPNPDTPDGRPYVWRDGLINPDTPPLDSVTLSALVNQVTTLTVAWWYTGVEAYGAKAGQAARTWFLDPATRMNPNLAYAQTIPGNDRGSYFGMIDFVAALLMLDGLRLMQGTDAWPTDDQQALTAWCRQLMDWMLTDELGRIESKGANNHGTWYDAAVCYYLLMNDRPDEARDRLQTHTVARIAAQIEPDGRQPLELARSTALGYSIYNLYGYFTLARLARHVGVDLWRFRTPDGRRLHRAVDFLLPYFTDEASFPYPQIRPLNPAQWAFVRAILRDAGEHSNGGRYTALPDALPSPLPAQFELLFPA